MTLCWTANSVSNAQLIAKAWSHGPPARSQWTEETAKFPMKPMAYRMVTKNMK